MIILASASPRRRELLKQIVPRFEVVPAAGEEQVNLSLFPEQTACALAEHKCDEVFLSHPEDTVIGCDTIVVFEGEILGKPKNRDDAARTLRGVRVTRNFAIPGGGGRRPAKK